jgi:hypothetical protein
MENEAIALKVCLVSFYQGVVCSDTFQLIFTRGQIENFVKGAEVGRISLSDLRRKLPCMYVIQSMWDGVYE